MVKVTSRLLSEVDYDREGLTVRFHNGNAYKYLGVPKKQYLKLLKAVSIGGYFNRYIRSAYNFIVMEG